MVKTGTKSAGDRGTVAGKRRFDRSSVTNGSRLFLDAVDGRSAEARRYRDLIHDAIADLGGREQVSSAQLSLVRRACALAVLAEGLEAKIARGKEVLAEDYTKLVNAEVRVRLALGLERRAKDVTPLARHLAERYGAPTDGAA